MLGRMTLFHSGITQCLINNLIVQSYIYIAPESPLHTVIVAWVKMRKRKEKEQRMNANEAKGGLIIPLLIQLVDQPVLLIDIASPSTARVAVTRSPPTKCTNESAALGIGVVLSDGES